MSVDIFFPRNLGPAEKTGVSKLGSIRFSVTKISRSLNLVCNPKSARGSNISPSFAPNPKPSVKSVLLYYMYPMYRML